MAFNPTPIIAGGLLVGAGLAIAVKLMRPKATTASTCGKCGYDITALPTFICPECGSDLRVVGIKKSALPKARAKHCWRDLPVSARRRFYAVSVGLGIGLTVLFGFVGIYTPTVGQTTEQFVFTPKSAAYRQLVFHVSEPLLWYHNRSYNCLSDPVTITIDLVRNDGTVIPLTITSPGLAISSVDKALGYSTADQQGAIYAWLCVWTRTPNSPAVRQEADDLTRLLSSFKNGRPQTPGDFFLAAKPILTSFTTSGAWTVSAAPSLSPGLIIGGVASLVVYLIFCLWLRREFLDRGRELQGTARISTRTLTVLITDLQGYSALTAQAPRAEMIALLRRYKELVDQAVSKRQGKVVKSTGDGFIAVFESATSGLLAGRDIRSAAGAETSRLTLRIALSTGDVVLENDDILGPAVNLASRLQSHAAPGEVWFSQSVFETFNPAEVPHEFIADIELRGLPGTHRVYRIANLAQSRTE